MTDHIWTAPLHPMDAEAATRGVLSQHAAIRALLERARQTAEAALEGRRSDASAVASAIGDIRTTMEVHLVFEEKVLLPLFAADPGRGPGRARRMVSEHRHQRAMLASLHQEAAEAPELPMLSVKLTFLTSWLLSDMTEEERELFSPASDRAGRQDVAEGSDG
jgi:Hemerythrin HHE cation binding domain